MFQKYIQCFYLDLPTSVAMMIIGIKLNTVAKVEVGTRFTAATVDATKTKVKTN